MSLPDLLVRFTSKRTFTRGGIHPPERKQLSAGRPIDVLPEPADVLIPLHQHTGAPCEAAVKPRTYVSIGDVIGTSPAAVSAAVHASVAGTTGMPGAVTLPNGRRAMGVPIKVGPPKLKDGEDAPPPSPTGRGLFDALYGGDWTADPADHDPNSIIDAIRSAGLVGQGGAAFPTHIKLAPNPAKPVSTVLLNGCECEPYLTADHRLMLEAPEPIVAGLRLAMRACGAGRGVIAIEDNKGEAIARMSAATEGLADIEVAVCQTKYPMGGERQLIPAVFGKTVPTGGLPLDVGLVVINVGTAAAIAAAILRGMPLTHRVVSVTGAGIHRPANVLAPIGVSIQTLLDHCGGLRPDARRVVAGGPMMGFTLTDTAAPVTKGTSGITVLSEAELDAMAETVCVRCGKCVDACPLNLVPTKIAHAAKFGDLELAQRWDMMACCECGCCAYVCPARIPLAQHIRAGKGELMRKARK